MSLRTGLDRRFFQALVKGLVRKNFFDDSAITYEYLREQIFSGSDLTEEGIEVLLRTFEQILGQAAGENWSESVLQAHLEKSDLPADHVAIFCEQWRAESARIHAAVFNKSSWNGKLEKLNWRIDVKTAAKGAQGELNEPTAIMELKTSQVQGKSSIAKFEISREKMEELVNEVDKIQQKINAVS